MSRVKLSPPESACAAFCTAEDIEEIKNHRAFTVARRIRAALGNQLVILPVCSHIIGSAPLFLATPHGIPRVVVNVYTGGDIAVREADERSLDPTMHDKFVYSDNSSYVMTRVKNKLNFSGRDSIEELIKRHVYEAMIKWLKEVSKNNDVSVGATITVEALVQEYLIRYFTGNITGKEGIPGSVIQKIDEAFAALQRTRGFANQTLDHVHAMFAREKWFAIDMGKYVILAGIDTTSLCQVAQDIVSSKQDPDSAYFYKYANKFNLTFTHGPITYRSFDAMPDAVRASLMSSFAFTKTTLLQHPDMGTQGESSAFFKLPQAVRNIASPDAGWVYMQNSHGDGYGQMFLMDKD